MLNSTTKNRINSCRDMLVGKLPDPKSQIDQITNALVYKFMDDQDRMSRELGYDASFFIWDYEQYAWSKLFDNRLTNQEKANLYSEWLDKLSVADHLPELFKQIFKNARLPFKDPSTITMFLAEINGFSYHHSEELGNAFEYLLSVMGSQWDTGSFRTPRHIIEFLVDVVDPKRWETIYDPACGTAWFLIEAFNHIKSAWDLSVSDTATLWKNISWVDIDPGMAKIARVNLYLHGFKTPNIDENDTLSNEKLWWMKRDVILANPPFMTPKGGIRPHEKFSSKTSKSEVLFTDYIIEHLKLHGRAGIIVPEGIMFNGSNAYKDLRKKLVDGWYLWAVASLPSGVFNPYAGVKTSILFLDRERAKNNDSILFVKISADGYDLGAQRREISKNDLPKALEILNQHKENPTIGLENEPLAHLVPKSKIAENGEYNLSGDRYIVWESPVSTEYEMVELGKVCETSSWGTPLRSKSEYYENGTIPWLKSWEVAQWYIYDVEENITELWLKNSSAKIFPVDTVLVAMYWATVGQTWILKIQSSTNQAVCWILPNEKYLPEFLYYILKSKKDYLISLSGWWAQPNISQKIIRELQIPLPPLEIQEQIVTELDGYQRIIDGARAVVENYKPMIRIDPEWEMVELGEVCEKITDWTHQTPIYSDTWIVFLSSWNVTSQKINWDKVKYISRELHAELSKRVSPKMDDVLLAKSGTTWVAAIVDKDVEFSIYESLALIRAKKVLNPKYLLFIFNSWFMFEKFKSNEKWVWIKHLHLNDLKKTTIPLPSPEIQQSIVERIEEEQKLVDANRRLIEIFEGKIREKMDEVWGLGK